ncbi:unnamed protein product [Musa acuminata subsp. malaccensis]|uniref:(wild Malaysian banana) hypothetical protein n=1 Tax=Musa acuminata subsp. malaccensis TaxID=214687 RepID=A0A804KD71_MUSAM|nr:unnamed protein product [Musa acuminata subsp. malaccensis]
MSFGVLWHRFDENMNLFVCKASDLGCSSQEALKKSPTDHGKSEKSVLSFRKGAELPVTSEATNPIIGSAAYAPENDALVWKIKSFPGGKVRDVTSLSGLIGEMTAEAAAPEKKASPIRVKFEILYFTTSEMLVFCIIKSGYQAFPWVRHITVAGDYERRLI